MKQISDLALNKQQAEAKEADLHRRKREEWIRKAVPTFALIVANLIFLSLDVRAFDVVARITGSILLASATVIVSGILALFWWDVLYPHSSKYSNQAQIRISAIGVVGGIILSLILAFLDYIVGSISINESLLWGAVILLTGVQAILLAWWWMIDDSRKSSAKRQKNLASRVELQEHTDDFRAEIESMTAISAQLEEIKKQFPGAGQAAKAARAMGYPILAQMLDDDDGDGIMNYQDTDWKSPWKDKPTGMKEWKPLNNPASPIGGQVGEFAKSLLPKDELVINNPIIYKDPDEPPTQPDTPSF